MADMSSEYNSSQNEFFKPMATSSGSPFACVGKLARGPAPCVFSMPVSSLLISSNSPAHRQLTLRFSIPISKSI